MKHKIFGCKVNKYYTDKWLNSEYLKDKKGVLISTCVVTDRAKKKWIKFVKEEAKKLTDNEKIYISGCAPLKNGKLDDDFFILYPELYNLKSKIELLEEKPKTNIFNRYHPKIYTKKFLLIQGGCDNYCTFCLTVLKRGKHYFRNKEDIIKDILEFEKEGGKEIVLTGINIGAWGCNNTNEFKTGKLHELLEYILDNTNIFRIRLSSLGPEYIDGKLLKLFENDRICPHFHYSIQSGSTKILNSMNRHYDGNYIKDLLIKTKNIKRNDGIIVSIGADLLIGFPDENIEDFNLTLNLINDGLIDKVHVFPFSEHKFGESIPASKFPNKVDEKIKKERVKIIEKAGDKLRNKFIEMNNGKEFQVLVEYSKKENNIVKWNGWTKNYIEVNEKNFIVKNGIIDNNNIIVGILK